MVGRWGLKGEADQNREHLLEAGADQVEISLQEMRDHLNAWLPVLTADRTAAKSSPSESAASRSSSARTATV